MATQTNSTEKNIPNGPAAAALLAGGIGAFFMGFITTLSEVVVSTQNFLKWVGPVGPLSGKVGLSVIVFAIAWFGLNSAWKNKNVNFEQIARIALVLLVISLIGTFPLFWKLLGAG
jgi:hypothetical protein